MNENLKDILNNLSPEVSQETLLQYLQKKLTPAQEHEVEAALSNDPFTAEALEGFAELHDPAQLQRISESLEKNLHNKLKEKRIKRNMAGANVQRWVLYAIIIILLLCVVGPLVWSK